MFPIRDHNPTRHRPILTFLIIVGSIAVFFLIQPTGEQALSGFLYERAAISCEIFAGDPLTQEEITSGVCGTAGREVFPQKLVTISLFTSMFLHAGLLHLFGNMWMLWIFGNNIEDRLRGVRFMLFYLGTGLVATAAFATLHSNSTVPLIGASGAIAGVMGAYLVLFPRVRITTIIPPLFWIRFRVPAALFLTVWFGSQFLISSATPNVAWEAHVGGFLAGVIYALLRRRRLV